MYKYNPTTEKLEQQPEMKAPDVNDVKYNIYDIVSTTFKPTLYNKDCELYNEQKAACKSYDISGSIPESWMIGRDIKESEFELKKRSPDGWFVEGNYSNTCRICKKEFRNTDKLWFWCKECCNELVAVPIFQPKEMTKEDWNDIANGRNSDEDYKRWVKQEQPNETQDEETQFHLLCCVECELAFANKQDYRERLAAKLEILSQFTITRKTN